MTTLTDLKPSQIKPHKNNPRRDVGDVAELADSIREQGLIEPLIVAPNGGTGKFPSYTLLAGHRRLAAAKAAKLKTVPCLVREDLDDPAAQVVTMLVENLQRSDLSPVEEADAYQQLLEFPGYSQAKIAQAVGRSPATVRQRVKLAGLPIAAKDKVHAGQATLEHALGLADFVNDPKRYSALEKVFGTHQFGWKLQEAKNARDHERRVARTRKQLEKSGVRLLAGRPREAISLSQEEAINGHRECEGFAAYINRWGDAEYLCDKPELHGQDVDDDPGDDDEAEMTALLDKAKEGNESRRRYLVDFIAFADADLALPLLRERVKPMLQRETWLVDALATADLGIDFADAKTVDEIVDRFGLAQLAVLLDVTHHSRESNLNYPNGWGLGWYDNGSSWRERLVDVYGYEWSPAERALLDAAAAKAAHEAEDDDEDPDFDDNPEWDDEDDAGPPAVVDVDLPPFAAEADDE